MESYDAWLENEFDAEFLIPIATEHDMHIPKVADQIIEKRVSAKNKKGVVDHLSSWEKANRSLTRALLAGAHCMPAPAKVVLHSTKYGKAFLAGTTLLEWAIITLERIYERQGRLSDEQRKEFERFMSYRNG